MNTKENNKLIASFMGAEPIKSYDPEGWWKIPNGNLPHGYATVMLAGMKFDSSWDWLMPVLEKIEFDLPDDSVITIEYKQCYIPILEDEFTIHTQSSSKLMACYLAIMEYIEWYNQQAK